MGAARGMVTSVVLSISLISGCHSSQDSVKSTPAAPVVPIGLSAHVARKVFPRGQSIPISLTVTNQSSVTCGMVAMADTTVQITRLTRDGKPLAPAFSTVTFEVVVQQLQQDAIKELEPGQSIDLEDFGATLDGRPGDIALTGLTAQPSGSAVAARFPMTQPGHYVIGLQYLMPVLPAAAPMTVCAGSSTPATVEVDIA